MKSDNDTIGIEVDRATFEIVEGSDGFITKSELRSMTYVRLENGFACSEAPIETTDLRMAKLCEQIEHICNTHSGPQFYACPLEGRCPVASNQQRKN